MWFFLCRNLVIVCHLLISLLLLAFPMNNIFAYTGTLAFFVVRISRPIAMSIADAYDALFALTIS